MLLLDEDRITRRVAELQCLSLSHVVLVVDHVLTLGAPGADDAVALRIVVAHPHDLHKTCRHES